jgi:hypothetical protein
MSRTTSTKMSAASDALVAVKRDKKVGLLINDGSHIFSNGIVQNAYFIYDCLTRAGYTCEFLCYEPTPAPFHYKSLPLKVFSPDPAIFRPEDYCMVITVTRSVSAEMYKLLKQHKVAIIAFTCGNTYVHHQEEFVHERSDGVSIFITNKVDAIWLIPSYAHSLEYLQLVRKSPVYIVPHLWSPEILISFAETQYKKTLKDLTYTIENHCGKKIDLIIMEPNVATFKTAWLPILIAEKFNILYPDLLNKVYVFNFPKHGQAHGMVKEFGVFPKLQRFARLSIPEILPFFNSKDTMPIFLSHQTLNNLNYTYYELMYFGYPLVHNSDAIPEHGYYYPDNDILKGVDAVYSAYKYHNCRVETARDAGRAYLRNIDPATPSVQTIWDGFMTAAICKARSSATEESK